MVMCPWQGVTIKLGVQCNGREKVTVPITKPFVSLIGMDTGRTVITWHARASDVDPSGHQVGTFYSASVAIEADYFCASHITFEVRIVSCNEVAVLVHDLILW